MSSEVIKNKSNECPTVGGRKKLKLAKEDKNGIENAFFSDLKFYVLPTGMGKQRFQLLQNQIKKYGGQIVKNPVETTYLVADDSLEDSKLRQLLKPEEIHSQIKAVKSTWLSKCFQEQQLLRIESFSFILATNVNKIAEKRDKSLGKTKAENEKNDIKYVSPDGDHCTKGDSEYSSETNSPKDASGMSKWLCSYSAKQLPVNYNQHITERLQVLAETYKNTNDHWRALGYQKAITVLRNYPKEIRTREEALLLPGIGQSLADKIWEIIESGNLRKIKELCTSSKVETINLFTKVWGAGPTTAEQWVQQGFQTLDDLRTKAKLTYQQEIGLKHFDDLLDRMPREEAGRIAETVKLAALSINPCLQVEACGSYRRGKQTCGDVDVLITHPDGKSHDGILEKIVAKLHETGFLTDDLVRHGEYGNQKKYLGVCRLNGENNKHRRLDIITVPYSEIACALLYFTGSAHFNRSMRLLARKKGMSLSEHSLNAGVVRKGQEKISEGYGLPTPTEESVFEYLGLQYRTPEERDH